MSEPVVGRNKAKPHCAVAPADRRNTPRIKSGAIAPYVLGEAR
jgi:hypothetical protein